MTVEQELQALQVEELDAGKVFSGRKSGKIVRGFSEDSSLTPTVNQEYIFHESMRDVAVWFMSPADPLYVYGPSGSGKTSLIKQLAAKLKYPVMEVTAHGRLEFPDLVGHHSIQNGTMAFQYGPLALAMKYGGLFILNEIDLLDPASASGLNGILDGEPLCIPENGGEVVHAHSMFRFAATANTNGAADTTGLYQGTLRQNLAFMDRFWLCEVGYPEKEAEIRLLGNIAGDLPESIRESMVEFANEVRRLFMGLGEKQHYGETIDVTFSTRTLIRWVDLTVKFQPLSKQGIQPVAYALDRALGFRAMPETRAMLHELAQRIFPQLGDG